MGLCIFIWLLKTLTMIYFTIIFSRYVNILQINAGRYFLAMVQSVLQRSRELYKSFGSFAHWHKVGYANIFTCKSARVRDLQISIAYGNHSHVKLCNHGTCINSKFVMLFHVTVHLKNTVYNIWIIRNFLAFSVNYSRHTLWQREEL